MRVNTVGGLMEEAGGGGYGKVGEDLVCGGEVYKEMIYVYR